VNWRRSARQQRCWHWTSELKSMKTTIKLSLILVILLSSLAIARVEVNDLGLSLWFPDDWSAEMEDDDMRLINPSRTAVFLFTVAEPDDLESTMNDIAEEMEEWVQDSVATGQGDHDVNGLNGRYASGTGMMGGQKAGWTIGTLDYKGKYIVMANMAVSSLWDDENSAINRIPESLKPTE
jgi:hypothetical protein